MLRGLSHKSTASKRFHQKMNPSASLAQIPVVEAAVPQFRFGVISDVQHARMPNGMSYHGTPRYYQNGLELLHQAVQDWKESDISFVLQMGDILDGSQPREGSLEVLQSVLSELEVLETAGIPTYHTLGNHCLYNLDRSILNHALGIDQHAPKDQLYPSDDGPYISGLIDPLAEPASLKNRSFSASGLPSLENLQCSFDECSISLTPSLSDQSSSAESSPDSTGVSTLEQAAFTPDQAPPSCEKLAYIQDQANPSREQSFSLPNDVMPTCDAVSYYSFSHSVGSSWRVIMLDGYDVSMLGWPASHPHTRAAAALLALHNPDNPNKNSAEGLKGLARRYVAFTGGIGYRQLAWLEQQLAEATASAQRVIVCSHLPFVPSSCPPACLQWDFQEVLALLQACPAVKLTLSGHTHQNGYALDDYGIHHVVLHGVVETAPGSNCHGRVDVFADEMQLFGEGTVESRIMAMRPDAVLPEAVPQLTTSAL